MPATFFQGISGWLFLEDTGQPAACFRDDFNVALDNPVPVDIVFKLPQGGNAGQLAADMIDRIDHALARAGSG